MFFLISTKEKLNFKSFQRENLLEIGQRYKPLVREFKPKYPQAQLPKSLVYDHSKETYLQVWKLCRDFGLEVPPQI